MGFLGRGKHLCLAFFSHIQPLLSAFSIGPKGQRFTHMPRRWATSLSKGATAPQEQSLSLSEKLSRLAIRMRDPEWRQYGKLLVVGKMMGVGLVLLTMLMVAVVPKLPSLLETTAQAQTAAAEVPYPTVRPGDIVNPVNTMWTLVAAFLVFGMQVGFTMLEAGFCRSRETVNVLMECVVDTCLCGLLFYAIGFSFMFSHGNGFIGYNWFFLQGVPATYEATGVAFLAFWLFQFAFADTCSTITSGAMIGRTGFVGDLIYSFFVSGFIYPIIGHWAWGPDGFLALMGSADHFLPSLGMNFHDFAGSTVVHTIGGFVALAGAIVLGPRLGRRFKRDGGGPMLPHDLTIAAVGGLILWFGWYGFNPGSTLSAMDAEGVGRVAANTTLAACAAGLTAMLAAYIPNKKWDVSFTVNGFLAGLVAITCPCYWVSPTGAIRRGGIAGGRGCSASSSSSGSGSMTRSARCRCTASAASGGLSRSACSPADSTARPGRLLPTTRRLSQGCSTGAA